MTEKKINIAIVVAILLAIGGFGAYQLSLAYPRNSFLAQRFDKCELEVGSTFRFDDMARLFCRLGDMDQLRAWAARK